MERNVFVDIPVQYIHIHLTKNFYDPKSDENSKSGAVLVRVTRNHELLFKTGSFSRRSQIDISGGRGQSDLKL